MKKYLLAGAITSLLSIHGALAQETRNPSANAECDKWGLSGKDLGDCRAQWAAAKTDAERDRVKAMYISPAFINSTAPDAATGRGSSTPPDNLRGPAGSVPPAPKPSPGTSSASPAAKPGGATAPPSSSAP
jgi:hypothetical protein